MSWGFSEFSSVVMFFFSSLTLLIWVFSLLFLVSLAKSLSILLVFQKKNSFSFHWLFVLCISISIISVPIFIISSYGLFWGIICSCFHGLQVHYCISQSANLCIFIGELRPLILRAIIKCCVLIPVFCCFCSVLVDHFFYSPLAIVYLFFMPFLGVLNFLRISIAVINPQLKATGVYSFLTFPHYSPSSKAVKAETQSRRQ